MDSYYVKTPYGTFSITPERDGVALFIEYDDELTRLGWYKSALMAADDVFMCSTGFDEWDMQLTVEHPADLSCWTKRQ